MTEALRNAPVTDRRVRDYSRVLFASASQRDPRRAGPHHRAADAAGVRRADQGLRRHRRQHPHRGLGLQRLAATTSTQTEPAFADIAEEVLPGVL